MLLRFYEVCGHRNPICPPCSSYDLAWQERGRIIQAGKVKSVHSTPISSAGAEKLCS